MTISTTEALERLPVGATIRVRAGTTSNWNRVADGFQQGKVVLGLDMFTGFVAAGQVEDMTHARPTANEWWVHRHYWYYILSVEDTSVLAVRIRRATEAAGDIATETIAMSFFDRDTVSRSTGFPEGLLTETRFMELMRLVGLSTTQAETQAVEVRQLKRRPDPSVIRPQVEEARTAVATLHADLTTLLNSIGRD